MSYYRNLIVNEHNELRNLLASGQMKQLPSPDRLATMQWHEELEKLATLNVKQCLFNYDQCHNTLEFRNSGQNLIMLNISTLDDSPSSRPTNETLIKYSIHSWWNQWRNVTWQHVEKFPKDKHLTNSLRHFAVMARDNSTYLGCAATRWLKQNVHHFLFACNYASNFIVDKPIYKLKTINCQIGYDKKYQGLCKAGEQYDKS
ncbi:uncharacterized protein Dwil_GK24087 [Drosophila willistoni]|uniref:SCP domain-containing protein n=2 Tax=Drosophila willistoni TaxID=7260 RepID=B4N6T4_DROWI|nr:uncharacterized protein Dwil_GK24087 [Drosophila willistoni]